MCSRRVQGQQVPAKLALMIDLQRDVCGSKKHLGAGIMVLSKAKEINLLTETHVSQKTVKFGLNMKMEVGRQQDTLTIIQEVESPRDGRE